MTPLNNADHARVKKQARLSGRAALCNLFRLLLTCRIFTRILTMRFYFLRQRFSSPAINAAYAANVDALRGVGLGAGCLILLCLMGCGGVGFSGGSIPEGKSIIRGRVIAADNPQHALAGLAVTVLSTPAGEVTTAYRVNTDAQGQFAIEGVVTGKRPTNSPATVSNVVVSVDTKNTIYQPQRTAFLLTADRPVTVILSAPPNSFDLSQVGSVSVKQPASTANGNANNLVPGYTFSFTALMLDHSGNPIISGVTGQALVPSLTLDGLALNSIDGNGVFEASLVAATGLPGGTVSPIGVGSTVTITGSISLPGSAPAITAPLSVPVMASQTTVSTDSGQITPGTPAPPAPPRSAAKR